MPGPGEVIIAVSAADVLLLDAVIRSGRAAAWFPITPPYVPGDGVAGRVLAVGEGVDPGWAGRAVIARTGGGGGSGGYAEQARVQAGQLVAAARGKPSWTCWPGWAPAWSWTTASRTGPARSPA